MTCPNFTVTPGGAAATPAAFGGSANRVTLKLAAPGLAHFGAVPGEVVLTAADGAEVTLARDVWTPGQVVVLLPDIAPGPAPYQLTLRLPGPPPEDCGPTPFFAEAAQATTLGGLVFRVVVAVMQLIAWLFQPLQRRRATLIELNAGDTWTQDAIDQGNRANTMMTAVLRNVTGEPTTVERALTLFCYTPGGFVGSVLDWRPGAGGPPEFFGWPNVLPAMGTPETRTWLSWPSEHVVHALTVSKPPEAASGIAGFFGRRRQWYQEIAVRRFTALDTRVTWVSGLPDGLTTNPVTPLLPYQVGYPVYVTLMGPIEAIGVSEIARGAGGQPSGTLDRRWLTVYGQVIGLVDEPVDVRLVELSLLGPGGQRLHHETLSIATATDGVDAAGNPAPRNPAHREYVPGMPAAVPIAGRFYWSDALSPEAIAALGGGLQVEVRVSYVLGRSTFGLFRVPVIGVATHRATVRDAVPQPVRFPLGRPEWNDAVWGCGNGPGASFLTGHNGGVATRYTYDFGLSIDGSDRRTRADGTREDGSHRANSLTWNQPLIAVADGQIYFRRDLNLDHNSGDSADPAAPDFDWDPATPAGGNIIVVRHDLGGRVACTVYAHVRQGSQPFAEGDEVLAGQELGRVGNNGNSSGPHLHFEYWVFNDAAEIEAIAPRFDNIHVPGNAAQRILGVPRNGAQVQVD